MRQFSPKNPNACVIFILMYEKAMDTPTRMSTGIGMGTKPDTYMDMGFFMDKKESKMVRS